MAATSLLALLDDITTMLDDVSVMSQLAAKKTAGVLGDDLALNAQQVSGIAAARELPVVLAVAKGSLLNKLILVPSALLISTFIPGLVLPLLMLGGAFLCFEGFEKVWHALFHPKRVQAAQTAIHQAMQAPPNSAAADLLALERDKIKGAIRTDFILSAEIIVIALGVVAAANLTERVLVLSLIGIAMTIGVYGLVACIVKMDDVGLYCMQCTGNRWFNVAVRKFGLGLVNAMPSLMRLLSVLGTLAMFLVGGGIISHGLPVLQHLLADFPHWAFLIHAVVGVITGAMLVGGHHLVALTLAKRRQQ